MRVILAPMLLVAMLSLTTAAFAADLSYSLSIKYKEGKMSLTGLELINGASPDRLVQPETGYTLRLVSFDNKILYSFRFAVESTPVFSSSPNTEYPVITGTSVVLVFPYFNNAKTAEIYGPNNILVLAADVSKYATCNMNKICDFNENYQVCPSDCKQESVLKSPDTAVNAVVGVVLIGVIIVVLFNGRKRK